MIQEGDKVIVIKSGLRGVVRYVGETEFKSGLWIGLELNSKIENLTLQNIMSSAYDEGLMILKANNNTLRLAPALTISEKEIKLGVKKLEKSLSRLL